MEPKPEEPQVKVVHLPSYADPYQRCLLAALNEAGVGSTYGRPLCLFGWLDLSILASMAKFRGFRVLHLHWQHPFVGGSSPWTSAARAVPFIAQLLLLKLTGRRIVWTIHNLVRHDDTNGASELFWSRLVARLADRMLAHCDFARRQATMAYRVSEPQMVSVIPLGELSRFFANEIDRASARERMQLGDHEFVFAFVGLIRPYKGLMDLAAAFVRLRSDFPECRLVIAGKSTHTDLESSLLAAASANPDIRLNIGYVPDDEMQLYMNAADVVVTPYRDILTSGSAITAMSFTRPVIAPAIGCVPETLGADSPLIYAVDDVDGLYQCMRWAIEHRPQLDEIGQANREAASAWNWRRIADETIAAYRLPAA